MSRTHWPVPKMSQSQTLCPYCNRIPGERHDRKICPRSVARLVALRERLVGLSWRRIWWMKGIMFIKVGNWGSHEKIDNPGVPYVKPPKPWYAGGIPGGGGPKKMSAEVREFIDDLRAVMKRATR